MYEPGQDVQFCGPLALHEEHDGSQSAQVGVVVGVH
jgi:hypothetical protein